MEVKILSVCIPTYNGEKYIDECLNSILNQSISVDFEVIIVDDSSTDNTYEIVKKYANKDVRIKVFQNQTRLGLVKNWNKCFYYASGNWIKFLFQDDVLKPTCLEKMLNKTSNSDFIICEREFIYEKDVLPYIKDWCENQCLRLRNISHEEFITPKFISDQIIKRCGCNFFGEPTSVLIKRELCFNYPFFNYNMVQICDLEYWTRLSTNIGLVYIPEELVSFRVHSNSASSNNNSNNSFRSSKIDYLILLHEYLYDSQYLNFRELTNCEDFLENEINKQINDILIIINNDLNKKKYVLDLINIYPNFRKIFNL